MLLIRTLVLAKHVILFSSLETRMNDTIKLMKDEADSVKRGLRKLRAKKEKAIAVFNVKAKKIEDRKKMVQESLETIKTELAAVNSDLADSVKSVKDTFGSKIEAREQKLLVNPDARKRFSWFRGKDAPKEIVVGSSTS